jgi:hypothetical protein
MKFYALILALGFATLSVQNAQAKAQDLSITNGKGEEIVIKSGRSKVIKDRFGNGYASKKGWFRKNEKDVSILGNQYKSKKGLLGGSKTEATTILGDKVVSKKGWFGLGRRKTTVDLSGTTQAVEQLLKSN